MFIQESSINRIMQFIIQKRMKTLNEAKKRIENSMEAKSGYNRFCNRGELYGNQFNW